jgi:hypothetical protein
MNSPYRQGVADGLVEPKLVTNMYIDVSSYG